MKPIALFQSNRSACISGYSKKCAVVSFCISEISYIFFQGAIETLVTFQAYRIHNPKPLQDRNANKLTKAISPVNFEGTVVKYISR